MSDDPRYARFLMDPDTIRLAVYLTREERQVLAEIIESWLDGPGEDVEEAPRAAVARLILERLP